MISKFQIGLKSLLRQGLSEPEFYGDLVYKLKKIVGSNNFSAQFIKIISHLKRLAITLMYRNRLHAWWSTQSRLATLLSFLIARRWVGLQTLWWFRLKDLSIDEMVGAWYMAVCQAHRGLPVGFLLLRYSVLFTVRLQTLWWFRLTDLSIDEMVGAWCFGCLSGPPWFTCWISFALVFSYIYFWVLIFVYLLFISWFICSRRWCIDKLGVFHANQISMCLDPHLN